MPDTPPPIDLKNRYLAAFLSWIVPGLGQWYQGRRGKAVLFGVCVLGLYVIGIAIGGTRNIFWVWMSPWGNAENFRFSFLCQGSLGVPFVLGLIQATLKYYGFGSVLWGLFAEPSQSALNALYRPLGPFVEVSWLYTTTAGLLNMLVIFDAIEGPALPATATATEPTPSEAVTPTPTVTPEKSPA